MPIQLLFHQTNNCPDIFEDMDKQISKQSSKLLDNIRFGMKKNVDYEKVQNIINLRNILTSKINCSNNFPNYDVSFLISLIRQNFC